MLTALLYLISFAVYCLVLRIVSRALERKRDSLSEPDPLLELAEAHRMELAVWDEQFRQVTGKLVDSPVVIQGCYSPVLSPGLHNALAQAQTCDNQYYQNQAAFAAMVRGQQQSQCGPQSLGGLLGGLGGIIGGIH